jgi:hypothetical protein
MHPLEEPEDIQQCLWLDVLPLQQDLVELGLWVAKALALLMLLVEDNVVLIGHGGWSDNDWANNPVPHHRNLLQKAGLI